MAAIYNKSKPLAKEKRQSSTKNDPGVGGQYEINVPAYFALRLNSKENKDVIKDFSIRSNVAAEFGNLDDIIIDVALKNGESLNFAFQLKHREKDKYMHPEGLEGPKGDFSLEKYCAAFKNIPEDKQKHYHYILYTCEKFDRKHINKVKKFAMVEDDRCPGKMYFDTSSNFRNIYKFEVPDEAEEPSSEETTKVDKITKSDYQSFFSRLTLYTYQKKFQEFEKLILDILKDKSVRDRYLNLFRMWHQGLFTKKTIDRQTINNHLVDFYLSSFMIMDYRLCDQECEKMFLLEKTTKEFDITIINDSRENFIVNLKKLEVCDDLPLKNCEHSNLQKLKSRYRIDPKSTLTDCLLRLAKEYKFVEKSETSLDEETKNKIFTFCFQNLLIVDFNHHSAEAIYKLMEVYQIEEDKIRFILLGHGVDLSELPSVPVFHNLEDLSKKNYQLFREVTTQCMLSLQGRTSISLKQLFEAFDDAKSIFEIKEIAEMLKSEYRIGKKLELPPGYVPRNVSTTVFDLNVVLNVAKNSWNIVIIHFSDGFKQIEKDIQNERINLVTISKYIENIQSFTDKPVILSIQEPNLEKYIKAIRAVKPGKRIHVFKAIADDTFILTRSTSIFTCENSNTKTIFQEEIHSVFDGTLNLLVGEPGMGKSTFMKHLTNDCPLNSWTIHTDLKSHSAFFSKARTNEDILAHFLNIEQEESHFLNKLKELFTEKKRLVIFLDGLDELPRDCFKNVVETMKSLLQMGHRVWVSSRHNLEERVANFFNIISLHMVEFCDNEQKTYIEDRLKPLYSEDEISEFIDRIFAGIRIVNNTQFLGVPLQLYILTQIFLDDKHNSNAITETFFVLTNLYRVFFEGRFQHCFAKYDTQSPFLPDAAEYLERYELAALESILDEESFQKCINCGSNERFLSKIKTEKDVLGIVEKVEDGKAFFEHQTYAEYFACVWFKNNQDKVKLLKDEFFSKNYQHLRLMFNMMMAENKPLHLSIVYKDLEQLEKHIDEIDLTDKAGRTALHIACSSSTTYLDMEAPTWRMSATPEPAWYIPMIDILFERTRRIYERDNLFNFDCLDYARASKCLYAIEAALRNGLINFRFWKEAVYQYYDKRILVYYCVELGYHNLLNMIIKENPKFVNKIFFKRFLLGTAIEAYRFNTRKELTQRFVNTIKVLIDNDVNYKQKIFCKRESSLLHEACKLGQFELVKELLAKDAHKVDIEMNTALHYACKCANPSEDIINLLLKEGLGINAPNDNGTTPFHLLCKNRQFDIVSNILKREESEISNILNTSDDDGNNALHLLAESKEDNKSIITLLIDKGIDVNSRNRDGRTPLHKTCSCFNVINSTQLLLMGAKVNIADSEGNTALVYAIGSSKTNEKLEMIDLHEKCNYDITTKAGTRVLNKACEQGDLIVVKTLMEKGVKVDDETLLYALKSSKQNKEVINLLLKDKNLNVNATDNKGMTALDVAYQTKTTENVQALMEAGAFSNHSNYEKATAFDNFLTSCLHNEELRNLMTDRGIFISDESSSVRRRKLLTFVSAKFNLEITEMLLKNGLDENMADENRNNALHYASELLDENQEVICTLIEAGFDVNVENETGTTPLQLAVRQNRVKNVVLLLQNGAQLNHVDKEGRNALHYASMSVCDDTIIMDCLISKGLDVDSQDDNGITPLQLACRAGKPSKVVHLLETGGSVNHKDRNGGNALHNTMKTTYNKEIIANSLIRKGLDLNSSNKNGVTPLQLACKFDYLGYVSMLVQNGANISHLDNDGNNALHYASQSLLNPGKTIDFLIKTGLNVDGRNNSGQTPLHSACDSENLKALRTLLSHGADVNILDHEGRNALDCAHNDHPIYGHIRSFLIRRGFKIRDDQADN